MLDRLVNALEARLPLRWIVAAFVLWALAAAMVAAFADCIPLPTCADNGNVAPCATPTPTLMWDSPRCSGDVDCSGPLQEGQDCIDGCYMSQDLVRCRTCTNPIGHRVYWRFAGWAWDDNRYVDLPCLLKKDYSVTPPLYLGKFCQGRAPTGWPVQRGGIWEGQQLEFKVRAYDDAGRISGDSNAATICVSPLCPIDRMYPGGTCN